MWMRCDWVSSPAIDEQEGDITWQKDGEDIDEDNVVKIDENSSKVEVLKATMADAGVYVCHTDYGTHTDKDEKRVYVHGK